MKKEDFDTKSWELCDQALANLRTKKLSPFPNNYQAEFYELLEKHMSDNLTGEVYTQESNSDHINKYLEIAQIALQAFVQSNQEITQVMQDHAQRTSPSHSYTNDYLSKNCLKIVDNLAQLDTEMSHALLKAHDQINHLTQNIELLSEENRIDPLTKFYNRKELFKDLIFIGEKVENEAVPECYLLMIDMDDFKAINDTYSHLAGDKTLVFVARTIASLIRSSDKAYRFGGDEFIIVLNRSTLDVAQSIAEKIRVNIDKARLFYENNEMRITVSIGVSKLSGKEIETSLRRADRALYEAKNKSKNQVFIIKEEN
ncbi:MAG: GGDEF domain-containing protein [Sulfuricurvum sp.]|nr:GGDEF domain-containing protein [Sulfuricurvum sp.]MDP3120017.1 GGDEF domain-containing protein [Sulfuricurvum sp.]